MRGGLRSLIEFYGILIYMGLYPMLVIFLLVEVNAGVYTWAVLGVCLVPPTLAWYIVVSRRLKLYLRSLAASEPRTWDVDKAVQEYLEVLKKGKSNSVAEHDSKSEDN